MSPNSQTLAQWLKTGRTKISPTLVIYQTDNPPYRPEHLVELARHLGILGERDTGFSEIHQKEGIHLVYKGEQVLGFYENSGAFFFRDNSKLNNPNYKPDLPSLGQAVEIASAYLKEHGWLPENAVLDGAKISEFEINAGEKERKQSQSANHIVVDYRLKFGDLETYGPGAKIKVYLGHRGEVIGLLHAARPATRFAELPPITQANLALLLARKLGVPLETVEVIDVRLALYAESYTLNSRFLQPTYIFNLAAPIPTRRQDKPVPLKFMTHPIPATAFGPQVILNAPSGPMRTLSGQPFKLSCRILGGTKPYQVNWVSNIDGSLSNEPVLETSKLSVAHRQNKVMAHTLQVIVTDANGFQDSHQALVRVMPRRGLPLPVAPAKPADDPADPYVGVEWCNLYHGSAPDISGTNPSAQGFKDAIAALPGWSARFDWGNDAAWEEDFKFSSAPGGGTDSFWADNVHFAFFAGHGSSGAFYFGSTVDDHQMATTDARWGDGLLNWIVLHACNTMMNNFAWTVWCDSFVGLHQMFGFHTTTEGSTPPLGSRFAFWASWPFLPWMVGFDLRTAWQLACSECFDSSVEYASIYANQSGTDTQNDHLPGFGYVSADPTAPNTWCYHKGSC